MIRVLLLLLACGLVLPGCGEEAPPVEPAPAKEAPEPPADGSEPDKTVEPGASAFRLDEEPDAVKHDLNLKVFKKGVPLPDPRDAIPAFMSPQFLAAENYEMRGKDQRVIVVRVGEAVHAYPIYILDLHELVNDTVGERPVLVSWCPLCGSAVVYGRKVGENVLTFGVSGYLYQSDVLMYDHQTESFWSQLQFEAVAGPMTGTKLDVLPSRMMTFAALKQRHPEASVLMGDPEMWKRGTYNRTPYPGYADSNRIWFPVRPKSKLLRVKAEVIGVVRPGGVRAYALKGLRNLERPLKDKLGNETLTITYDAEADDARVQNAAGRELFHVRLFWFAWFAFHPDTDVWRGAGQRIVSER